MEWLQLADANTPEPEPTRSEWFGPWLTVAEAVLYCTAKGLPRTPKTLRKWARHSAMFPESADLEVRREDVDNGERWVIERSSLDRKIDQEREFEARRARDPVRTGTVASEQGRADLPTERLVISASRATEPEQTGSHPVAPEQDDGEVAALKARVADLKSEVAFLREELKDRRNATAAITSIIDAFRLSAGNSSAAPSERHAYSRWSGDKPAGAHGPDAVQ